LAPSPKDLPLPIAATGTTTINREVVGDEYVTALQFMAQRARVYTRMRRGDGAVNVSLAAIEKPILGARWDVDGEDDVAEACRDELFSSDQTAPYDPPLFEDILEHLLSYFQFGFAAAEPLWNYSDVDGRVHCTSITRIRPESVRTFKLDEARKPLFLTQYTNDMDKGYIEIDVPVDNLLLAVNQREGSDYSGTALIRSSYRAFLERDTIRKTRLWHHDRFGAGTPTAVYPEGADDEVKIAINEALENFRSGSSTYLAVPFGTTLDIKGGNVPNATGVVEELASLAAEIAKNTLSQLTELGTSGNTGNRALGVSFTENLRSALQGSAERLATLVRRQILTPFVRWNFGESVEVPALTVRVTLAGVQELLTAIGLAVTAGLKLEPEDMVALRDELELPEITVEELAKRINARAAISALPPVPEGTKRVPPNSPGVGAGSPASPIPGPGNGEPGAAATATLSDPANGASVDPTALAPDHIGRLRPAKVVALEATAMKPALLSDALDREAVRASADVHDVLKQIDTSLVSQVKALAEKGGEVLTAQITAVAVPPRLVTALKKAIASAAQRAEALGRESVLTELGRQGLDVSSPPAPRASGPAPRTLAERLLKRWLAEPDLYGGLAAFLRSLVDVATTQEVNAREVGAQRSALSAVRDEAANAGSAGADAIDFNALAQRVQSDLEDRSVGAVESRVSQVLNVSFGQGRVETGQLFGSDIQTQTRSAVLDSNTCDVCAAQDGDEYDFGDPSAPDLPDPQCEGGDHCRCVYIYALASGTGDGSGQGDAQGMAA